MKNTLKSSLIVLLTIFTIQTSFANNNYTKSKEYVDIKYLIYLPKIDDFIFIAKNKDLKQFIVNQGKEGKKYDNVDNLKISQNGENYSYSAMDRDSSYKINYKYYIENGKEYKIEYGKTKFTLSNGKTYNIRIRSLVYTPKLEHIAFVSKDKDGKYFIVKDGVESKRYKEVYNLKLSKDGNHYFFQSKDENGKLFIVKDGIESRKYSYFKSEAYDTITELQFIGNGNHYSFRVNDNNGKAFYVIDGIETKRFKDVYSLKVSDNGKHKVFKAKDNNGKYLIIKDGIESEKYHYIQYFEISDDWNNLKFYADDKNVGFFIINGKKVISKNEKKIAYITEDNNGNFSIIKNGIESEKYDYIKKSSLQISKDGKHTAFIAGSKEWGHFFIVIDGIKSQNTYKSIDSLKLSSDFKHYAFIVHESFGKNYIISDGIKSKYYIKIDKLNISSNGYIVAFKATKDNWRTIVVKRILSNDSIIKSNTKINKILNKFFIKVDKKGKKNARILYKQIISKIDILIEKSKNNEKTELLKYIKSKINEKLLNL